MAVLVPDKKVEWFGFTEKKLLVIQSSKPSGFLSGTSIANKYYQLQPLPHFCRTGLPLSECREVIPGQPGPEASMVTLRNALPLKV